VEHAPEAITTADRVWDGRTSVAVTRHARTRGAGPRAPVARALHRSGSARPAGASRGAGSDADAPWCSRRRTRRGSPGGAPRRAG
jgi:hypothetical protein